MGRNADVYDIGEGRVLRRYRDGRPAEFVAREAEVMAHARAHGVPVPEVFDVSGCDIVMERAAGPTMLEVLARQPWTVGAQARLLARMHAAVHQVPALDWLPAPFGNAAARRGAEGRGSGGDAGGQRRAEGRGSGGGGGGDGGAEGHGSGRDGVGSREAGGRGSGGDGGLAGEVLLHRDLHPLNVILTADGPRIIDWEGAARGPGVADVAMTWVIVAFSRAPGSRLQAAVAKPLQTAGGRAFLRAAGPVDRGWLETAVRHRIRDPNLLPEERARLERVLRGGRFARR